MKTRVIWGLTAALSFGGIAGVAQAQVPTLFNGGLDIQDPVWFAPRPQGFRVYNTTQYRRTDDGQLPAAVTRNNSAGSIFLPGALGQASSQFVGVHSEEFVDPNNPVAGRNWPQYTFDPANGAPIRIGCWFNIPASDPVVGGRFGMKVCFLRSGSNFSCYQEVEWLDIDPNAATAPAGMVIVPFVAPPPGSGLTGGPGIHTNGQWVRFERTFNQSEFGSFPTPPTNPARASLFALRFSETTNSFGTVWVDDISFTQGTPCRPDIDNNTVVNVDDIFVFLGLWFAQDPRADFDNSGSVGIDDIFVFLGAWFAGC